MLKYKLQEEKEHLTSAQIAKSVKTNPAYIRQLMAALKRAGLISNTQGQANACLTRPADQITMLDIYRAVEGDKPLLHLDVDTNPECGIGIHVQLSIGDFYREIQETAEQKMREITLQDIIDRYHEKIKNLPIALIRQKLEKRDLQMNEEEKNRTCSGGRRYEMRVQRRNTGRLSRPGDYL